MKKILPLVRLLSMVVLSLLGTNSFAQTTQTFSYTGANQTFTVPAGVTSVSIKAWGAGGAGAGGPSSGGSGALVKGNLSVTPGDTYIIVVGGGGRYSTTLTSTSTYGGGGASGGRYGASGGGYSGIFLTSVSQVNAIAVSGGGGGAGYFSATTFGGAGGATTGSNGGDRTAGTFQGGRGATVIAGGAAGTGTIIGTAGTILTGGTGAIVGTTTTTYNGGGGGGGYYGGGGGYGSTTTTNYSSGGGGGSSFLGSMTTTTNTVGTMSNGTTSTTTQAPGSAESGYVSGVGNGGSSSTAGGNGLVIITYTLPACVTPAAQPTALTFGTTSATGIAGSFTAVGSPNTPSGYMIVRSTSATAPIPSNGTTYATASTALGAGTYVVQNSAATTFSDSGLTSNSRYYYYIFSYNNGCTGAPSYRTALPLNGNKITCPAPPTAPVSSGVTSNSAVVSWTSAVIGGNAETLKYRFELYTDATRTTSPVAGYPLTDTTSPVSISGLNSSTPYYYRIISYNSSCNSTNLDGTFITSCVATPITVTEGFNVATVPNCWSIQYPSTSKIFFLTTGTNPTTAPFEGTRMVQYNSFSSTNGAAGTEERLISLPMSSLGTIDVDVEFFWRNENSALYNSGAYLNEGVQVQYSLNGTTWTDASGGFFPRLDTSLQSGTAQWNKKTVTIPTVLANASQFYIAFKFHSEWGDNMYLDAAVIKPGAKPIAVSSSSALPICSGNSTTLTATSTAAYTYTWSPATGLNTTSGASVIANPSTTTTYTVTGTLGSVTTTKDFAVTVNPSPTDVAITPTPVFSGGITACDLDYVELKTNNGTQTPELINENFNVVPAGWQVLNAGTGGGTPANASWTLYPTSYLYFDSFLDSYTFVSNDNSPFAMSNSDFQEGSTTTSNTTSLISPAFNTNGLTNVNLSFFANYIHLTNDHAYLDISTDGGTTWNLAVRDYTSDIGTETLLNFDGTYYDFKEEFSEVTVNLDAYINQPNLKIRFRFLHSYDYWWAIDNVKVVGTRIPVVSWSPTIGLYKDSALTTAYAGENLASVYAAPDAATAYTATSALGTCTKTATTASIIRTKKVFTGNASVLTDRTLWNVKENWTTNTIPTSDKCVSIPSNKNVIVNIADAAAKKVTVDDGGTLTINPNQTLIIQDGLINNNTGTTAADKVVIASDGNLIQINPSKTINSGSVTAERAVTGLRYNPGTGPGFAVDYVYWSSPVFGQKTKNTSTTVLDGFSPGTKNAFFYDYRESNDRFYQTADASFTPGKGYAVRAEEDKGTAPYNKTYTFKGELNNGDFNVPVSRSVNTGTGGSVIHGYNMIGNPYPSNISFDQLYAANSGLIYNTAYFWTNVSYQQTQGGAGYTGNNYAIYNGTGGNPSTSPPGYSIPNGIIKVGQGFLVQSKGAVGSNINLQFKNSYGTGKDLRVSGSGTFYQKDAVAKNRFTLQLTSPDQLVNSQLIGYISGATDGYEQDYDAEAFALSANLFYSTLNDKRLLIQGKSGSFTTQDKVNLGANFFQNGTYSIALANAEGIFAAGQTVYLKDKLNNVVTNLSQGSYTFMSSTGESTGRFEIIYQPEAVLATDVTSKEVLVVYKDSGDFVVKAQSKKITDLQVFDMNGRLIYSVKPNAVKVTLPASKLINGSYLLKIDQDGYISTKKIIR